MTSSVYLQQVFQVRLKAQGISASHTIEQDWISRASKIWRRKGKKQKRLALLEELDFSNDTENTIMKGKWIFDLSHGHAFMITPDEFGTLKEQIKEYMH